MPFCILKLLHDLETQHQRPQKYRKQWSHEFTFTPFPSFGAFSTRYICTRTLECTPQPPEHSVPVLASPSLSSDPPAPCSKAAPTPLVRNVVARRSRTASPFQANKGVTDKSLWSAQHAFASYSDSYNPYERSKADLLDALDQVMIEEFKSQVCWGKGVITIPPAPTTPAAAQKLHVQVEQLLQAGELHRATPWAIQLAIYCVMHLPSQEHHETLRAVYTVIELFAQRGTPATQFIQWLLPRAGRVWGHDHPSTAALVRLAVQVLAECPNPTRSDFVPYGFVTTVTYVGRDVPCAGSDHVTGLAAGHVTPMSAIDEAAYTRHAIIQARAEVLVREGNYRAARTLLQRCVAFYATLGPHWLGTPRRCSAGCALAACVAQQHGHAAAEPILRETVAVAKGQLGRDHAVTLQCMMQHAECLLSLGCGNKAVAQLQKVVGRCERVLGTHHHQFLTCQVSVKSRRCTPKHVRSSGICSRGV